MNKTKKIISLLLTICILLSITACSGGEKSPVTEDTSSNNSSNSKSDEDHYPLEITTYDYAGNEVVTSYEKAPEKVLCVYQGSIETMIALGLEEHVAMSYGLDNSVKEEWEESFSKMQYNDSVFAPDKESVVMLKPDMILSWGSLFGEKMLGDVDYWIENGTNTYINTNTRAEGSRILENEYTDILNIGKIFNVEEKAEAMVDEMKVDAEKSRIAVDEQPKKPTVLIIGFRDKDIRNYGMELAGDIASKLGMDVLQSEEGSMGKEDLLKANPDVVFVEYMPRPEEGGTSVKDEELAKLVNDPAFASLGAIQNKRVYPIMLGEIYAPAVRTADGIRTIASGVFPDIFEE